MIHESPKPGADNKLIAFLHPKSTNGVLIESKATVPTNRVLIKVVLANILV